MTRTDDDRDYTYTCNLLDPQSRSDFGAACYLPKNVPLSIDVIHNEGKGQGQVLVIDNFLSAAEAAELVRRAAPHMHSSTLVHEGKEIVSSWRTSKTGTFYTRNTLLDPLMYTIRCRASALAHYPVEYIEDVKVVKYDVGEFYKVHHDAFHDITSDVEKTGNRIMTFFVYLSDHTAEQGCATHFPRIQKRVQPKVGRAVLWLNLDEKGNRIMDMEHEGEPPLSGPTKWGLNIWIRTKRQY